MVNWPRNHQKMPYPSPQPIDEVHARKLFLEPYQYTWIHHFLLWFLSVGESVVELIAGWLLFKRREVAGCFGADSSDVGARLFHSRGA
jgi:hypothetical protein